jgi:tripartite-type tricarboxylate transporter receptor subunit TctC
MDRRKFLALGLATTAAQGFSLGSAFAQSKYPDHPIRLVIPFPPGGVNDAVGRPWADKIKSLLGTVVVENQGGAGGAVGAAAVARAAPDGYTLLLGGGGALLLTPLAATRPVYDPVKDFEPIALLAVTALTIAVNPAVPANTLKELIEYAKANPGKLSYASAGVGSLNHLIGEMLKSVTGIRDLPHIPYKGAGPAVTDAISGHVPIVIANINGQLVELHRTGRLRILAVTSPRRLAALPDIPTAVEGGVPGMVVQNFVGLFAPAWTPKAIIAQIDEATRKVMADADLQRSMMASGLAPELNSTPEGTRRFVEAEIARLRPIIHNLGFKLE